MDTDSATFSPCEKYRYDLIRQFAVLNGQGICNFIILNPSTADYFVNDPTVSRCISYAKSWGFGALIVTNIFAFRSTNPRALKTIDDPVGPLNNDYILQGALQSKQVICAWGDHGNLGNRSTIVREMLDKHRIKLYYLRLTNKKQPGHPLYLSKDIKPTEWKGKDHE